MLSSCSTKSIHFCKKTTTWTGLQVEQIFLANIQYTHFVNYWCRLCSSVSMLFPKGLTSCDTKKIEIIFAVLYFYLCVLKKGIADF